MNLKQKRGKRSLALLLLFASTGWTLVIAQSANAPIAAQATPADTQVPPQIATLRTQWLIYFQNKQIDKLMPLYAQNAMFLDSSGQRIIGPAAIRSLCRSVMNTFNSELHLYSLAAETSGELAYESGNYQENLTQIATGSITSIHGTYLMLFKHQADGSWKILEQVWTQAPPMQVTGQ